MSHGERDGVRKKPAPDTVFEALRLLGVPTDGTPTPVYIGDSDVDIATAAAAGYPVAGVADPYSDQVELRKLSRIYLPDMTDFSGFYQQATR